MKTLALICALFVGSMLTAQTTSEAELMVDAQKSKDSAIATNAGIENFFNTSAGYVIFPNVGKGAFIVGAASGNGIVYENSTAIGTANLKKLDIGAQIGGAAFTQIIFFEDEASLKKFKENDFEFTAGLSAIVLKSGKSLNAKYRNGVAVFAVPKAGLMAEVAIGGQKFLFTPFYNDEDYDNDDH